MQNLGFRNGTVSIAFATQLLASAHASQAEPLWDPEVLRDVATLAVELLQAGDHAQSGAACARTPLRVDSMFSSVGADNCILSRAYKYDAELC